MRPWHHDHEAHVSNERRRRCSFTIIHHLGPSFVITDHHSSWTIIHLLSSITIIRNDLCHHSSSFLFIIVINGLFIVVINVTMHICIIFDFSHSWFLICYYHLLLILWLLLLVLCILIPIGIMIVIVRMIIILTTNVVFPKDQFQCTN